MPQPQQVEFALSGTVDGVEISPRQVPFALMRKFHDEVERLIFGSNLGSLGDTLVEVRPGSYGLVVPIPESVRASFESDLAMATESDGAGNPDPARFAILQLWQKRATVEPTLTYHVRPKSATARLRALRIDAQTPLRRPREDHWVPVELMLLGEVREAGGERANIHVKLRGSLHPVIIAVSRDALRDEPYPFAGEKLLRVAAERNERTKKLRKLRLLAFVPYRPEFDEAAFAKMTAAGATAWEDVPDAAQWVREQRGA